MADSSSTGRLLDGEATAAAIRLGLVTEIEELAARRGAPPGLGTILVGDDGPSARYVAMKHADCAAVGIRSYHCHLPASASQSEVIEAVDRFNADPAVDAFIVQIPLPKGLDEGAVLARVRPEKDADGLHPVNLGRLVMGIEAPLPCTPNGIVELLVSHGVEIPGKHVVVIGRGLTIGRPLALMLAAKGPRANAAVTVVHTGVPDLGSLCRQADILVAAAGSPGVVKADMVKPGAAVVGAGVSFSGRKLLSDLDDGVSEVAGWVTPRLGGVGPMTRAMLLANTVAAAARQ